MLQNIGPRQFEILKQLLANRRGLSVDELAKNLNVSRTAIQQHFIVLESHALIKKDTLNKTAGRPVALYVITDKGINYFPKQYAWFSELILSELMQELGEEGFKAFMQRLGSKLALDLRGQFEGKALTARIDELIGIMTDLGYQADSEGESEPGSFTIKAINCVYHDLALKRNTICEFDLSLISALLDRPVTQVSCMVKGDCSCRFKVTAEPDS